MANESADDNKAKSQTSETLSMERSLVMSVPLFDYNKEFAAVCEMLNVPLDVRKKAEDTLEILWSELDQQDEVELLQSDIFVCVLYMALVDARMPYGPRDPQLKQGYLAAPALTITELLQKTNTSVKRLLEKMHVVKDLLVLSEAVTEHLVLMEKNFCVVSALSHTFDRLCESVFREEYKPQLLDIEANEENIVPPIPETEGVTFRRKLCWLLFLHAKHCFLGDNPELMHGFLILLCCLEYVMRTTPSFLLNSPYDIIRIGCQQISESSNTTMLTKLAEQFSASVNEIEELSTNYMEPCFQELLNRDGELDLDRLEEFYLKQYAAEGDLNELMFLTKDPLFFPSTPKSNGGSSSISLSNSQSHQPMTPVRATLYSIQQLKSTLATATDEPSPKLREYFQACTNNPSTTIAERLLEMREMFVKKFEEATSPYQSVADPRYTLGVKMYYRMLELLLDNETKRLSQSVMNTLLNKNDFHCSLVACCLEVVLVAYGLSRTLGIVGEECEESTFAFPWILDVFKLQAYDFSKVLESFVRADPKLPADIVKHLQNIEYKILESIAWREGSSLFDIISVYERGLCTPPKHSSTESMTPPNNQVCPSAAEMFLSPLPSRHTQHSPSTQNVISSPGINTNSHGSGSSPAKLTGTPRRSHSLTAFFNKVYRLAYYRLQKLCTMLLVGKDLQQKIWTCFEKCVTYRPDLLKNRHIDQILMCSIYGVCKVVEQDLLFKTIAQEYRNLPHVKEDVCKRVYISCDTYGSIILFYNQIFMHNMKSYILHFSNNKQTSHTLSPAPNPLNSHSASPMYSVSGRKNFYISPLKESPFKAPRSPNQLTPASRQLYCFGDRHTSSEKLRDINASVSAAFKRHMQQTSPTTIPKVRRLIQFDQPPSEGQDMQEGTTIVNTRLSVSSQKGKRLSFEGTSSSSEH